MPKPKVAKKKRSTKKELPVRTGAKDNAPRLNTKTNTMPSDTISETETHSCQQSKVSQRRKSKKVKIKKPKISLKKVRSSKKRNRKSRTIERKPPNYNFAGEWPPTNHASQSEFSEIGADRKTNWGNLPNLLTLQFNQYRASAPKQEESDEKNMVEPKKHLENHQRAPSRKIDPNSFSPFQCLLAVYADLVLEEDVKQKIDRYKKIVDEFCKKLLILKDVNDKNCFNKSKDCEQLRAEICQLGHKMLSSKNSESSGNHAILQELKYKAILAYVLYVESQAGTFCNHTEFAVPITTLILEGKPKDGDVLISKDKLEKLLKAIDANIKEIYEFLNQGRRHPDIKVTTPKTLASSIKNDILELFKEKGLLEMQAYSIRL